ncbi:Nucleic acid-binding OB-fold [Penicillium argentinense]|uniref:Nucleic acid-binding OB-fold n=1 Tax=Penicillium argentinense TaxID=1131581 RepID=A0A9W9JVG0_9EURO|nr:Nucleic acid-binding OB-fold [Penicillium argentinense]KAJ5082935.1 Nucleic acid-binding OB-fold [Penicillium argentinense]
MGPSHLLRAALPIRSIASPLTLARSTILPSTHAIAQSLRYASTESAEPVPPNPVSPTTPPPKLSSSKKLQPPAALRTYAYSLKTGTVVSVGRMERTVTVSHRHNVWDKHIRKFYPQETNFLVSDPRNSLREGDVIEFSSGMPKSRHVSHVVERIITPFATPIQDRPAVMSRAEREVEREQQWAAKYLRRESRRLGEEVDIQKRTQHLRKKGVEYSDADLIRLYHGGKARVGRIKGLVEKRAAELQESENLEEQRKYEDWLRRKSLWEFHEAAREQARRLEEARQES